MGPTTKTNQPFDPWKHRLPIEKYALLTENSPELGEKLNRWYAFYRPASPGECELTNIAVMSSVELHRVQTTLTQLVNDGIRTARFDYDCDQEDQVTHYRAMLETDPGTAVVGLKRLALGARFLISRWERLLRLLDEQGTWYGLDRTEAINYQGAKGSVPADLYHSEGAYLTWLYCLMCQPEPKDEHFVALGNELWMPAGLSDRKTEHWFGEGPVCRKLLREMAERELALLRPRNGCCGSTSRRRRGTAPSSASRCSRVPKEFG